MFFSPVRPPRLSVAHQGSLFPSLFSPIARFTTFFPKEPKEKRLTYQRLTDIFEMLPNVLPMVHEVEFQVDEKPTKRVRVKFRTDYGWLPIESLSYGYQTMISWIVDFTRRMYDRYPDAKDPLAEPAIVLVDEIDLHLHPKWQRELMGFLSKRFPKTQFIVTAHSPLIIQSEEVANVILLQRDPKKPDQVIVRQDDVAEIRKWRLDQILTSDLYGLESATAPSVEKLEVERNDILAKPKISKADERRLDEIEKELEGLPVFSGRDAIEAEQLFKETAERLAQTSPKAGVAKQNPQTAAVILDAVSGSFKQKGSLLKIPVKKPRTLKLKASVLKMAAKKLQAAKADPLKGKSSSFKVAVKKK